MMANVLERSVNLIPWRARHWIKHIPLVARLQRRVFQMFLSGREFLHTINAGPAKGLVYPISLPLDKAIWTGAYEQTLAQVASTAVNVGDVCYDIGAYRGFFTGVFALAGAGQVIAFEPFAANCNQLQRLVASNPQLPISCENIAIGSEDGIAEFNVMADSSMGKLASSSFQAELPTADMLQVPLRKIDSLVSEAKYPPPQIMKIDVEGAEVQVLEGARQTLQVSKPILFIEAHSRNLADACTELLEGIGYRVRVFDQSRWKEKNPQSEVCHLIAHAHAVLNET